ncbi:MAG: hypothetical protein WBQ18_14030 [Solirubrobacteraceae bacterium]
MIRTHPHQGSPPESVVTGTVVCVAVAVVGVVCVAWTLTEAELVTVVVEGGGEAPVAVLVTVWVPPALVRVPPALVVAVTLATAVFAWLATLDAALVTEPDPQPASTPMPRPRRSAARSSRL